jgi:hypothetical protein
LSPGSEAAVINPHTVLVRRTGGALRVECSESLELVEGWVAPRYGVKQPAAILRAAGSGELPCSITTDLAWEPV